MVYSKLLRNFKASDPALHPYRSIHRQEGGIHLRSAGDSLFPVAWGVLTTVIYIIIASAMKTLNTTPSSDLSRNRERNRIGLTVAGIVIAIFCSFALFQDADSVPASESKPSLLETSEVVSADILSEVKTMAVMVALSLR